MLAGHGESGVPEIIASSLLTAGGGSVAYHLFPVKYRITSANVGIGSFGSPGLAALFAWAKCICTRADVYPTPTAIRKVAITSLAGSGSCRSVNRAGVVAAGSVMG